MSFSRVDSNVETFLGATTATGLTVSTGQTLDLEGMVTGTDPVQLSVRAWVDGTSKPDWQQTYSDSSDSAITDPGGVRLWGYLSQNAELEDRHPVCQCERHRCRFDRRRGGSHELADLDGSDFEPDVDGSDFEPDVDGSDFEPDVDGSDRPPAGWRVRPGK